MRSDAVMCNIPTTEVGRPATNGQPGGQPLREKGKADEAEAGGRGQAGGRQDQGAGLVALVEAGGGELFRDSNRLGYVSMEVDGHQQTWLLRSGDFKDWLKHRFYKEEGQIPSDPAVEDAVSVLSGKAVYDGPEEEV